MTRTYRNTIKRNCCCGNETCHKFWLDCTPKKSWKRYIDNFHQEKIKCILHSEGI